MMTATGSPAQPGGIDTGALRRRYRAERDKRLRPDGNDQYLRLSGALAHYLDDPYTPKTQRPPKTDHAAVVCIGGGFAGLVTGAQLKKAGVGDVRIIEKGGDLIDTDGRGVERITPTAVVVAGREYEVDCIIYASGFEVGTSYTRRCGYEVTGRDGRTLSDYWADGMRTLHGIHVHGFPGLFIVQPTQGANLISNIPHNIVDSAMTIAVTIRHAIDNGFAEVEPSKSAEEDWITLLRSGPGTMLGGPDCTPGYYNNEGQGPAPGSWLSLGYPYGPNAYFSYIEAWRASGRFDGLDFR